MGPGSDTSNFLSHASDSSNNNQTNFSWIALVLYMQSAMVQISAVMGVRNHRVACSYFYTNHHSARNNATWACPWHDMTCTVWHTFFRSSCRVLGKPCFWLIRGTKICVTLKFEKHVMYRALRNLSIAIFWRDHQFACSEFAVHHDIADCVTNNFQASQLLRPLIELMCQDCSATVPVTESWEFKNGILSRIISS